MMETKRRREQRSMLPVHPDAAAIDIGATVHVAAVGPARDPEPVRSFGTFTGDLHRLADWLAQCGIKTVVMTHLSPSSDPNDDFTRYALAAKKHFSGAVLSAQELMN